MSFGIANFDSLPPNVKLAFEDLEAWVTTFLLREHSPDGTHGWKPGVDPNKPNPFEDEGHWWKKGPWIFDDPAADKKDVIALRPPDLSAGTYHNYAPQGIDNAVIVEQSLTGAITITGIQARSAYHKRLLVFRNNDASLSITLKHDNTGSLVPNRFSLPDSKDVVLAAQQNVWLYYSQDKKAWTLSVTPHQSGGLQTMVGVLRANLSLTEAQLEALNTTPITIVAAAGASTVIFPLHFSVELTVTTGSGTSPTFTLVYEGNTVALTGAANPAWGTTTTKLSTQLAVAQNLVYSTFDPRNVAVQVRLSANPDAAFVGSAIVSVAYYLATVT